MSVVHENERMIPVMIKIEINVVIFFLYFQALTLGISNSPPHPTHFLIKAHIAVPHYY